jgi:F-box domain
MDRFQDAVYYFRDRLRNWDREQFPDADESVLANQTLEQIAEHYGGENLLEEYDTELQRYAIGVDEAGLCSLPNEILIEVFKKLDTVSQMKLRAVCSNWNYILREPAVTQYVTLQLQLVLQMPNPTKAVAQRLMKDCCVLVAVATVDQRCVNVIPRRYLTPFLLQTHHLSKLVLKNVEIIFQALWSVVKQPSWVARKVVFKNAKVCAATTFRGPFKKVVTAWGAYAGTDVLLPDDCWRFYPSLTKQAKWCEIWKSIRRCYKTEPEEWELLYMRNQFHLQVGRHITTGRRLFELYQRVLSFHENIIVKTPVELQSLELTLLSPFTIVELRVLQGSSYYHGDDDYDDDGEDSDQERFERMSASDHEYWC